MSREKERVSDVITGFDTAATIAPSFRGGNAGAGVDGVVHEHT